MSSVSIFPNVYEKKPHYISVEAALDRIQNGRSGARVTEVREALDAVKRDALKKSLPAIAFSGRLTERGDKNLEQHSGFICLDFDKLDCPGEKMAELQQWPHTYAAWLSPSGNGLKVLVKVADGEKHGAHFDALREVFPDMDEKCRNVERLCFESFDPNIYRNPKALVFTRITDVKTYTDRVSTGSDSENFVRILKWLTNRGDAFSSGNRNTYIFKLAGACCRFGFDVDTAASLIEHEYPASNDFTRRELLTAVKSGFKRNAPSAGSASFEQEILVNSKTHKEVSVKELPTFDPDEPARDVIYGADVKAQALEVYHNGFEKVQGVGVDEIDERWKPKRGEITLLTGLANYGKSAFWKWYMLMRAVIYGERFASFSPEDNPPHEYYHDFVEMLLGCDCTPRNENQPPVEVYDAAYDWVSQHIFYMYPQDDAPTPEYVLERFLEMKVKEKVDGVCIDPFNQMSNDYGARSDKYLETILNTFHRFAQSNDLYFLIIAHPKQMTPNADKNFSSPRRFDVADGAMWSNKIDNGLTYHRPFGETEPNTPLCTFDSWKIKRKVVGKKGSTEMRYVAASRRFEVGSRDPLSDALKQFPLPFLKDGTWHPHNNSNYSKIKHVDVNPEFWLS